MQAIETKYFGPGNVRGSRIKATCAAGSVTVGYDHALNLDDNHRAACQALVRKLGWDINAYSPFVMGVLKNGNYVFVSA